MLLLTFWHNDRAICCLLSIFAHINTLGSCEIGSYISIIIQAMKKLSHVLLTFLVGVLCTLNTTRLHAVTTRHYLNGCQLSSRFSTIYIFLGFSPDSPCCVSYSHLIGCSWWRHQPYSILIGSSSLRHRVELHRAGDPTNQPETIPEFSNCPVINHS